MWVKALLGGLLLVGWTREAAAEELLVFDWNGPVAKSERGFPWDKPPKAGVNGDWTTPHDFANGTVYHRVEIRSQPVVQDMNLQFCFWQKVPDRETCGKHQPVKGTPGNVVTWSVDIAPMWKKNNLPLDWTKPRDRNGVAIKDTSFKPVSDYVGWNWNGNNPDQWYPLDMRFTVVVVSKGGTFSGWSNYIGTTPPADGGPVDSSLADTQASDAGIIDKGLGDAGGSDAGASDGPVSAVDAASKDLAPVDGSASDGQPNSLEGASGCRLASSTAAPGPLLLAAIFGLLWRRRRRQR
jgi:MYXO-CTERM domain-containing protein